MNSIRVAALILCLAALFSCSGKSKKNKESVVVQPTLIHPLFFQDEINQLVNFPFWFNDSIIRAKNIQQIRFISFGSALDLDEENDRIEELPKKTILYTFNAQGKLIAIQETTFSEGIIISNQSYKVTPSRIPAFSYLIPDEEHLGMENSTYLLVPVAFKPNVLQFDNEDFNERYHFIANKKYFGALSVDSIAHPRSSDWVVLGTYSRPEKKYKVQNKVREYQVTTYEYWNSNYPKATINDEFPFTKKRTYTYRKGIFTGYVDSTFIDQEFVTKINTNIYYDKNQLPVHIEHIKKHSEGTQFFKKQEQFEYIFRETNEQ